MESILKAKVIIELLDDRKYPVLSSFSNDDLTKLNNVSLEDLNQLSASDINTIINDFLKNVEEKASELKQSELEKEANTIEQPASLQQTSEASQPVNVEQDTEIIEKPLTMEEKIQQQPIQLLACAVAQLDSERKDQLLSHLSEEQKAALESIEVEKTPVTDQIVKILLSELELT